MCVQKRQENKTGKTKRKMKKKNLSIWIKITIFICFVLGLDARLREIIK